MPGRGRGRGRAPPTGGRLFLMRSAEECGYDARNLRSLQDITRPELFPPMLLHSSGDNRKLNSTENDPSQPQQSQQPLPQSQDGKGVKVENDSGPSDAAVGGEGGANKQNGGGGVKRSSQTLYLITKGREIHHRIQDSAFHIKTTKDVPDIIRYSDATKPPPITDASTILSHCLRGRKRTAMGYFIPEELASGQKLFGGADMSKMNASGDMDARDVTSRPRLESLDNADGGAIEEEEIDQGSEDDGEDYVADYYASEEEDMDGDNEATF